MDHLALAVSDQERSRRFYEHWFGFEAEPAPREDGVLILHDANGFSLALGEVEEPISLPPFLHFGTGLGSPDEVRAVAAAALEQVFGLTFEEPPAEAGLHHAELATSR